MDEYVVQGQVGMPRGSVLRIEEGVGMLIYVWEGELWVTQDGSPRDHVLKAGQWFQVDRAGPTVGCSLSRAVISLTAPRAEGYAESISILKPGGAQVVLHREHKPGLAAVLRRFWQEMIAPLAKAA